MLFCWFFLGCKLDYRCKDLSSGIIALRSWSMAQTRMDSRVESVEASLADLQETVKSHSNGLTLLTDKLDMVLKGQALIASELAGGKFGPDRPGGGGDHSTAGSSGLGGSAFRGSPHDQRFDFRPRRMEMPIFSGGDPDEWGYRAERYFGLQRLSEAEQLEAAIMCLEGAALHWFRWENSRRTIASWEELKGLLEKRFRSVTEGSLFDRLLRLRQGSSVQEYRRDFEALASSLGPVEDSLLV